MQKIRLKRFTPWEKVPVSLRAVPTEWEIVASLKRESEREVVPSPGLLEQRQELKIRFCSTRRSLIPIMACNL